MGEENEADTTRKKRKHRGTRANERTRQVLSGDGGPRTDG
jgi:hypothetical protein